MKPKAGEPNNCCKRKRCVVMQAKVLEIEKHRDKKHEEH